MRRARCCHKWLVALLLAASPAGAYYHYIHYLGRSAPFNPAPEKFDLNALPGKTVTFFVSDAGPALYATNDSFPSVLSQIRQAALAWDSVQTSDLRVAFGGLYTAGTAQSSPGGEVVFDELPPGVLGFGGPTATGDVVTGPNGSYVPIVRAVIRLNRDLTRRPGPSFTESFLLTVVHEMGHALGLQHTFTSGAMSTAVTRATSRARPLHPDDIAGISLLYPARGYAGAYGSISGRVSAGGDGVHLASVVALRPNGYPISALTNPDGSYRIDGLPPDTYWVYVHPLPPTADIVPPVNPDGEPVAASGPIETIFYPGTRDAAQAAPMVVGRGSNLAGIDFAVQRRTSVSMYGVSTYSFFGQNPVSPAYISSSATIAARGSGVTTSDGLVPGLAVRVFSGSVNIAPNGVRAYGQPQTTLALDLAVPANAGTGPRHLLFSTPGELYVLPAGLNLAERQPPSISSIAANADSSVTVTGTNFTPDSRVFFDGAPAQVRIPFVGNDQFGGLTVMPPPGTANQHATLTVFGADGQNSMFLQSPSPVTYTYGATDPPSVTLSVSSAPAGSSALVDINATNTRFVDGLTGLGFGSSDVTVRRIWVLSPTRILANVTVSRNAAPGGYSVSLISGFQVASVPSGFQILAVNPRAPGVLLPLLHAVTGQASIYPGAPASLYGTDLITQGNATVTLNDQPVQAFFASPSQINFVVPPGIPLGPAVLKVHNGQEAAPPVLVQIDPAPPTIVALTSAAGGALDQQPRAGDTLSMIVSGLDASVAASANRLKVTVGPSEAQIVGVAPVPAQPGIVRIQFILPVDVAGPQPLTVSLDGISSAPFPVTIR